MNDTLIQKIQSTQRCIQRARDIYRKHQNHFLHDHDAQDAAVLNLIRSCELAIDMANYIIKRDKLGIPASSAESLELFARSNKINHELAQKLKQMVGFRNIAVHEYQEIYFNRVIGIIEHDLDDLIAYRSGYGAKQIAPKLSLIPGS